MSQIATQMRAAIDRLQVEVVKLPQIELRTDHHFAKGMYLRKIFSPAGSLIVGKVHKTEHFYGVLTGRVQVTTDDGVIELNATRDGPQILTCPVGTKRAVLVLEDAWRMNVHLNPKGERDIAALEEELVEHDDASMFLPGNVRKQEAIA